MAPQRTTFLLEIDLERARYNNSGVLYLLLRKYHLEGSEAAYGERNFNPHNFPTFQRRYHQRLWEKTYPFQSLMFGRSALRHGRSMGRFQED